MPYRIGQKVCLWQLDVVPDPHQVRVVKEVIVTITEVKEGVPGEFSREPIPAGYQSLRGVDENGVLYEKHWNSWPESQTSTFIDQWTWRGDDGEPVFINGQVYRDWTPIEAIYVYDSISRGNKKRDLSVKLVGPTGEKILPKGDITYCEKHGRYSHEGVVCLWCHVESQDTKAPAA